MSGQYLKGGWERPLETLLPSLTSYAFLSTWLSVHFTPPPSVLDEVPTVSLSDKTPATARAPFPCSLLATASSSFSSSHSFSLSFGGSFPCASPKMLQFLQDLDPTSFLLTPHTLKCSDPWPQVQSPCSGQRLGLCPGTAPGTQTASPASPGFSCWLPAPADS